MSDTFTDGQRVKAIFWSEGGEITANDQTIIQVIMENGQMDRVPWFGIYKDGTLVNKYNGALLEGVTLYA